MTGLVPATLGREPLGNERLFFEVALNEARFIRPELPNRLHLLTSAVRSSAPLFALFYQVEIRHFPNSSKKEVAPLNEASNAVML